VDRIGRTVLRYYPSICPEGLRKTTKNVGQESRCLDRNSNSGYPEYETDALTFIFWRYILRITYDMNVRQKKCDRALQGYPLKVEHRCVCGIVFEGRVRNECRHFVFIYVTTPTNF